MNSIPRGTEVVRPGHDARGRRHARDPRPRVPALPRGRGARRRGVGGADVLRRAAERVRLTNCFLILRIYEQHSS